MLNCMVDLETMGTSTEAPIVSIGAVMFNMRKDKVGKEFYVKVSLESAMHYGNADAGSIRFWLQQPDEARHELCGTVKQEDVVHLPEALKMFKEWLPKSECDMWGNGCSFDIVILETMFRRCKIKEPWDFWNHKCLRTLKLLASEIGLDVPNIQSSIDSGTLHNALDDARAQALLANKLMRFMQVKKGGR